MTEGNNGGVTWKWVAGACLALLQAILLASVGNLMAQRAADLRENQLLKERVAVVETLAATKFVDMAARLEKMDARLERFLENVGRSR